MNTTKAWPDSPEDRSTLGQQHSFHPRPDWLPGLGSGVSDTATLTLFYLGWLLYCAGVISFHGMIGLPGAGVDTAGGADREDLVVRLDRTVATTGTVSWPFDRLRATRGAGGPPPRPRRPP
jgi:hypothetical protein